MVEALAGSQAARLNLIYGDLAGPADVIPNLGGTDTDRRRKPLDANQ